MHYLEFHFHIYCHTLLQFDPRLAATPAAQTSKAVANSCWQSAELLKVVPSRLHFIHILERFGMASGARLSPDLAPKPPRCAVKIFHLGLAFILGDRDPGIGTEGDFWLVIHLRIASRWEILRVGGLASRNKLLVWRHPGWRKNKFSQSRN